LKLRGNIYGSKTKKMEKEEQNALEMGKEKAQKIEKKNQKKSW
jgi:hypothetical protein